MQGRIIFGNPQFPAYSKFNFSIFLNLFKNVSYLNSCKYLFLLFALLILNSKITAQESEIEKLIKLDIEELTDLKIISATKTINKISEVPAVVKVITSETIKQNGYLTLEEALADLPGFQFRNILGFNSYVFQRGIANQNNLALLLVDGIEINEQNSGGFYAGGQFNLDDVEQIEIVYGPASALYGTNAISGIINVITKEPEGKNKIDAAAAAGNFKTYNGSVSYNYYDNESKTGIRISGMYKTTEKANLAGAEGDFNWTDEMENFEDDYSLNVKGVYKDFKLGLLYQNKKASRTTNYKTIGAEFLDRNTLWDISFINAYLRHDYNFSDNLDLLSTVSYRNSTVNDNTVAFITNNSQTGFYRPSYSFVGETMLSYSPSTELKINGGILFKNESLAEDFSVSVSQSQNQKPVAPPEPVINNNNLISIYALAKVSLTVSINLFAGARYDHSTYYGNVFTPRMSLVFNKDKVTIKALYSEAFRAPKPWDYKSGIGNPDLKSEEIKSFELYGNYYLSDEFQFDISFYKNQLAGLLTQEIIGNSFKPINKGEVETKGIESSVHYQNGNLKSYVNYTYNYSVDDNGAVLPEIAKHSINAGVSISLTEDFDFSLRGNYIGERDNPKIISTIGSNKIKEAVLFNSSLIYKGFQNLVLNFTIKNIFDTVYYHPSNRPPDRYRQPQRSILFQIYYSL